MRTLLVVASILGAARLLSAAPLIVDMSGYRATPQLEARVDNDALVVQWAGESNQQLRASFGIQNDTPIIREMAVRNQGRQWSALGPNLRPVFGVTTGIRRTNHGLPEENRWDVFWDVPLNHTNDVQRFSASYHATRCDVKTDGARLEISFPGLEMGIFSGRCSSRFTAAQICCGRRPSRKRTSRRSPTIMRRVSAAFRVSCFRAWPGVTSGTNRRPATSPPTPPVNRSFFAPGTGWPSLKAAAVRWDFSRRPTSFSSRASWR